MEEQIINYLRESRHLPEKVRLKELKSRLKKLKREAHNNNREEIYRFLSYTLRDWCESYQINFEVHQFDWDYLSLILNNHYIFIAKNFRSGTNCTISEKWCHSRLIRNGKIEPAPREDEEFKGPVEAMVELARIVTENAEKIFCFLRKMIESPVLRNRKKVVTVLCIYKFRTSTLSMLPKDIIRLVCERLLL